MTGWDFRWVQEYADQEYYSYYDSAFGSYGKNSWVTESVLNGNTTPSMWYDLATLAWHNTRVRGTGRIPLFGDCTMMGGFPEPTNGVPGVAYREPMQGDGEINRWCIDRHNLKINMVFLDFTVRQVGLKQLWQLYWHRNWDLSLAPDPRNPELWSSWIWPSPVIELGF